jgi:hypothetical protein
MANRKQASENAAEDDGDERRGLALADLELELVLVGSLAMLMVCMCLQTMLRR